MYRLLMKLLYCWLLIHTSLTVCSQSIREPNNKPDRSQLLEAHGVRTSVATAQLPAVQAKSWKAETENNPKNTAAWLNYYLWTSRDKTITPATKEMLLAKIAGNAEQNTGLSASSLLIRYLQSGNTDSASLHQAFVASDEKHVIYPYLIQHAIIKNDKSALVRFTTAFSRLSPLSAALKEYYHNVLMSADSNAVVYAQGLNDLVSLATLQEVDGVRKDISLNYFTGGSVKAKAYLCLSVGKEAIQNLGEARYTGLLVQAATSGNGNRLQQTLEQKFKLEVLDGAVSMPAEVAHLYKNYLPSFILLYKYLEKSNPASAEKWEQRILKIARWTASENAIQTMLLN